MNEDAAQKSDSGEKFNGSSQRRKKPKKVNCCRIEVWLCVCVCNISEAVETVERYE